MKSHPSDQAVERKPLILKIPKASAVAERKRLEKERLLASAVDRSVAVEASLIYEFKFLTCRFQNG